MTEALSLVPWTDEKLRVCFSWLKRKYDVTKRVQEYSQLLHWTRSSLAISTVFDWGHTCDLAEALASSAKYILLSHRSPSLSFTSRTLFNRATSRNVSPELWQKIIERIQSGQVALKRSKFSSKKLMHYLGLELKLRQYKHLNRKRFLAGWILHDDVARCNWLSWCKRSEFEMITQEESVLPSPFQEETLKSALETALYLSDVCYDICRVFYSSVRLVRCCDKGQYTIPKRAQRKSSCNGVSVQMSGRKPVMPKFHVAWEEVEATWLDFLSSWDQITEMASKEFPFPEIPGIDSLILHDMATGFVASSKMLRTGAKHTGPNGTTIVHPGERAAVVSAACKLLCLEYSAIKYHSIDRPHSAPAKEFAEYALLRCDLVSSSRKTFESAVRDWNSHSVAWDRVPDRLSNWPSEQSRNLDASADPVPSQDNIRLVLLRQALGQKRSINIFAHNGMDCTVFGGFIAKAPANYIPPAGESAILIDRTPELLVTVHKTNDGSDTEIVADRWGHYDSDGAQKKVKGMYLKRIEETGRPGICRLRSTDEKFSSSVTENRFILFD